MTRAGLVALLAILHATACVTLAQSALPPFLLASHLAAKLLAVAGAFAAFAALRREDGLRRFWGALGVAYLLLALAELPAAKALPAARSELGALLTSGLLLAANVVGVVASALLAFALRAPRAAGARLAARLGTYLLASLAVAAVIGAGLVGELGKALAGGGVSSWASAMSYACDAATFVMLVPVVRRALAPGSRSRAAAGPLWAFTASGCCWLLFSALEQLRSPSGASALVPAEGLRTAATLLAGLAGLYQWDLAAGRRAQAAEALALEATGKGQGEEPENRVAAGSREG
jgi:hypothetical protein